MVELQTAARAVAMKRIGALTATMLVQGALEENLAELKMGSHGGVRATDQQRSCSVPAANLSPPSKISKNDFCRRIVMICDFKPRKPQIWFLKGDTFYYAIRKNS